MKTSSTDYTFFRHQTFLFLPARHSQTIGKCCMTSSEMFIVQTNCLGSPTVTIHLPLFSTVLPSNIFFKNRCMSIYKPPSCRICYSVLFYFRSFQFIICFVGYFYIFIYFSECSCQSCWFIVCVCEFYPFFWLCLFLFSTALLFCFV